MAIVKPSPPANVTAICSVDLPSFLSGPGFGSAGQLIAAKYAGNTPRIPSSADLSSIGGIPVLREPQQVFVLGLGDAANQAIGSAVPAGWRLFAGNQKYKIVMGRVKQATSATTGWKLTATYHGDPVTNRDRVWDVLEASNQLLLLPEVQTADYELRVLTLPGLNLETFWLVAQAAGASDLVVPFPAAPNQPIRELNTAVSYSMADFLLRIAPLAHLHYSARPLFGS